MASALPLKFTLVLLFLIVMAGVGYLVYEHAVTPSKSVTFVPQQLYVAPENPDTSVTCSVDRSYFCHVLGYSEADTDCSFETSWLNSACQLSCDATVDAYLARGLFPSQTTALQMGLSRKPNDSDLSQIKGEGHDEACRLMFALYYSSYQQLDDEENGYSNFYYSMASCIQQKYNCG